MENQQMYSAQVAYRATTLFHIFELLEGHVCSSFPELRQAKDAMNVCLPQLAVMAGELSSVDDWFGGADE